MGPELLPQQYKWLASYRAPKMIVEGLRWYGLQEASGPANNPTLMRWARELGGGVEQIYTADSIPWCGLYVAYVALVCGKPLVASPLWARAWATWGEAQTPPGVGDVLVFSREGGGHVGFYVAEDRTHYHVLGGNQDNRVKIVRIAKSRCIARRRYYATGAPKEAQPQWIRPVGAASINEV